MIVPHNYDNPSPLSSLEPARWGEAQKRVMDAERKADKRARFTPPTDEEIRVELERRKQVKEGSRDEHAT